MFTGIIQNKGLIVAKRASGNQVHFKIRWMRPEKRVELGESVAHNGVCLTVASVGARTYEVDLIRETLDATNLGDLQVGDSINLERSLRYGDPMGGHFVSGHVDACGRLLRVIKKGKNVTYVIGFPRFLRPYIIQKGSVAVDGISLTVQSVQGDTFSVGLVPHTLKETNLGSKKIGDRMNLEVDLLCRYLEQFKKGSVRVSLNDFLNIKTTKKGKLKTSQLQKMGF